MEKSIIGREKSKKILRDILNSDNSEFLAIYGRRRIGKTFLVREMFRDIRNILYMEVTGKKGGSIDDQIDHFCQQIEKTFTLVIPIQRPKNWKRAFLILDELVKQQSKKSKIVIFLDELPWLASPKSGVLGAIDHLWNSEWTQDNRVKLIICGSAASWMLNKVINDKGGLHNRLSERINLMPLSLMETKIYLEKKQKVRLNTKDLITVYMAIGGVPLYLDHVKSGQTAVEIINNLCFCGTGILFDEFDLIFNALFNESQKHVEIIKQVTKKRKGITRKELLSCLKLESGGGFNKILNELVASGFVDIYTPYGKSKKDSLIRVNDEYCYFYLKWINPKKNSIKRTKNYWHTHGVGRRFESWAGYAFEAVMLKHAYEVSVALGIEKLVLEVGSWSYISKSREEKGAQIDMLFDRSDENITIVEIKFSVNQFVIGKKYADELENKLVTFKRKVNRKKGQLLVMLTINGVQKNAFYNKLVDREVLAAELLSV
ncbi:MAG: AAA family ATPase [Bacteriovoracaceae bacterium]|nr:AAA family ATPase [Bacteriovoracaceae bacterium]